MQPKKLITILEILNYSAGYLKEKGISEPRLNAELLMAEVLNCKRLDLYLQFDKPLIDIEKKKYKEHLFRRVKREPLQYILGHTNFYGYNIEISNSVFIPRPDTEVLVEEVLKYFRDYGNEINILEIASGSGCIAVALTSELKKLNKKFNYFGIDINIETLKIAEKNLKNNNCLNAHLLEYDFLSENFSYKSIENKFNLKLNCIVSNPPYIPIEEYNKLDDEVKLFEPKAALTDGGNGMTFYEKFIELYNKTKILHFLEIAYNSKNALEEKLKEKNINDFEFIKDYGNNFRVLRLL